VGGAVFAGATAGLASSSRLASTCATLHPEPWQRGRASSELAVNTGIPNYRLFFQWRMVQPLDQATCRRHRLCHGGTRCQYLHRRSGSSPRQSHAVVPACAAAGLPNYPGRRALPAYIENHQQLCTSKQETSNQRRELEAVAKRSGWEIVKVYEDAGISGAKGRDGRPGLDAMLKAVNTKEFEMVATWSVDRLGRSLTDLLSILQ
jgi:hypothetical protein